jgi:hypothetical protein
MNALKEPPRIEASSDWPRPACSFLLTAAAAMFVALPAPAPAIGTPGSPSATVTLDGKQLPPPPLSFGGVIKESYLDSTPYWPPRVVSPKGAPNILLIMRDADCTRFHAHSSMSDIGFGYARFLVPFSFFLGMTR